MRIFGAIAISVSMLASVAQSQTAKDLQMIVITRSGPEPPRSAPAENFTGSVRIDSRFEANEPARLYGARVAFEPGARTAWHTHVLGQLLIVTAGTGRVQRWGDPVEEIRQGDIVWIPPGQKHWHGAAPNTAMASLRTGWKRSRMRSTPRQSLLKPRRLLTAHAQVRVRASNPQWLRN